MKNKLEDFNPIDMHFTGYWDSLNLYVDLYKHGRVPGKTDPKKLIKIRRNIIKYLGSPYKNHNSIHSLIQLKNGSDIPIPRLECLDISLVYEKGDYNNSIRFDYRLFDAREYLMFLSELIEVNRVLRETLYTKHMYMSSVDNLLRSTYKQYKHDLENL